MESWAERWGMRFNAKKCYTLSVKQKTSYFYQLNKTILQEVDSNPYLGVIISKDLQWTKHIDKITKKANSTLGFIKRNLKHAPQNSKRLAYISLVRSTLEYAAVVWDPYKQGDINKLERTQRHAARFITRDYKSKHEGCVRGMLRKLGLPDLQDRRMEKRLVMLYKIVGGMVPAMKADAFLTPIKSKRKIRTTKFKDCDTKNIIDTYQTNNNKCYKVDSFNTEVYKNSFFVKTVCDWNTLNDRIVGAETVSSFSTAVQERTRQLGP